MKAVTPIATVLVIVGALNWGLVALFQFDLVAWIFGLDFGETDAASRIVYGLVGIAGIVLAAGFGAIARRRAPVSAATGS